MSRFVFGAGNHTSKEWKGVAAVVGKNINLVIPIKRKKARMKMAKIINSVTNENYWIEPNSKGYKIIGKDVKVETENSQ
jgi:thiazole synthase ThiGH ThiG subunit